VLLSLARPYVPLSRPVSPYPTPSTVSSQRGSDPRRAKVNRRAAYRSFRADEGPERGG
jgi:hypothetical protein